MNNLESSYNLIAANIITDSINSSGDRINLVDKSGSSIKHNQLLHLQGLVSCFKGIPDNTLALLHVKYKSYIIPLANLIKHVAKQSIFIDADNASIRFKFTPEQSISMRHSLKELTL